MKSVLMRPHGIALMLGFAVAVSACGSDSTDPGSNNNNYGNTNNTSNCTVTLSGAQTGSPACTKVTATWTSNNNKTAVGISAAGGSDTVSVGIGFDGEPTSTTYTLATGASAVMFVVNGVNGWQNSPATSWSLTISSVTQTSSGAGLKGYQVHGTLTATLLPVGGISVGPLTVVATF